jgi:hypothetical protein
MLNRRLRFLLAVVTAPVAVAAAYYSLWLAWCVLIVAPDKAVVAGWDLITTLPRTTRHVFVTAFEVALRAEILVGLPLLALFRRLGWLSVPGFLAGGCIVAIIVYLVVPQREPPVALVVTAVLLLIPACIGAWVFGYVGGWLTGRSSRQRSRAGASQTPAAPRLSA